MKNKGFTLIELMTVIVVLSIVLMISYAVIRNNIEISKKETFKTSVRNVLDAAKEYVIVNFDENDFPKGGVDITDLELKNNDIKSGIVTKDEDGKIIAVNLSSKDFCANGQKNDLRIDIGSCDRHDDTKPEIDVKTKHIGMDSMTFLVSMQDAQSGVKELEYCNGNNCKTMELDNDKTDVREFIKFKNLSANKKYTFKFKVISNNEDESYVSNEVTVTEKTLEIDEPKFKVSSSVYALSKIVEITYPDVTGYTFKYKVNDEEIKVSEDRKVQIEVNSRATITAYIYNGDDVVIEDTLNVSGIDNKVPQTRIKTVTTKPENREAYNGYVTELTVEFESSDAESGLAMRPYSYDGGKSWERSNKHTFNESGNYKIYVRDRLGNINKKFCDPSTDENCVCDEEECTYTLDLIDAEGPICGDWSGESTDWIKGSRTISVTCNDLKSGCTQASFSKVYSDTIKTDKTSIVLVDKLGNKTTCTKDTNLYVDNTAPSCGSFTGQSTSWSTGSRTIGLTCSDGHSGCSQESYSKTFTGSVQIGSWSETISDKVGNTRVCSSNLNIYLDNTTPTINLSSSQVIGSKSAYTIYSASFGPSGKRSFTCSPATISSSTNVTCTAVSNVGLSRTRTDYIRYVQPNFTVYFNRGSAPHGRSDLFSGPSFSSKTVTYGQPYGQLPTMYGAFEDLLFCSAGWGPCSYDPGQNCQTGYFNVYTWVGWMTAGGTPVTASTIYTTEGNTTLYALYSCTGNSSKYMPSSLCP